MGTILLCLFSIGKLLAPTESFRNFVRKILAGLAEGWISVNNGIFALYRNLHWNIEVPEGLDKKGCYLVSSNHQSWVDVLVLQRAFNRRLPFFRFFIKSELFWVPFLGVAWWSLDMPFMKRHSRETIAKQPSLKGQDLENARIACEKFRTIPVAMTNFPEGTRFTRAKRDERNSSYQNLLQPRIGGIGQVFYALAEELDGLVDVTIIYPQSWVSGKGPTFWQLLRGDIHEIVVRSELREIPPQLLGRNFRTDRAFRSELESWMSAIWQEKDQLIADFMDSRKHSDKAQDQSQADAE